MFGLFKKRYALVETGLFQGYTDYHSHILPGVDDGIRSMDSALEVLKHFETLGVKKVWLTPHIMEDIPNTTELLRKRFEELKETYHGNIELRLSAENMVDSLFVKRLAEGDVLPYGENEKELLVETSYVQAPYGFRNILEDIKKAGYTPVLAHPERYRFMDYDYYDTLRAQCILFQMNVLSLTGAYGPEAQQRAEYLLTNGYYTYRGTDIHKLSHFMEMTEKKLIKKNIYTFIKEQ